MSVWLPQHSWARMGAVLDKDKKERPADLIRLAVELELQRREGELASKKKPKR